MCFMLRLLDALPLTHGTLESDTAERCRQVLWPVSRPHELLSGQLPRNRIDQHEARAFGYPFEALGDLATGACRMC